jgi:acyl-[acyl-carrier-protein]-phospholipid O-acyltransferase/long-chain-fatty-acid--[acyl-carrier-protein] ligase
MPACSPSSRLWTASFAGLVLTQFLGAFNDNMFRWLAVRIGLKVPGLETGTVLAIGGICFTLPYLLLTAAAGSLADRYRKRDVIVVCKVSEIVIMLLGVAAVLSGSVWGLFSVVALMGAQSALFAPSKFGTLPEMLDVHRLSEANGVMGLATVTSSALGTVAGYWLFDLTEPDLMAGVTLKEYWPAAVSLVGVAVAGVITSLPIEAYPAANPERRRTVNPLTETLPALRLLFAHRSLLRAALGIAFFWFLASLAQMNLDRYGEDLLALSPVKIGLLAFVLVAGVGTGSVLAGVWSAGRVELGLVPCGALATAASSLLLWLAGSQADLRNPEALTQAFYWSCLFLFLLGGSAGLFNIPLEAFVQHRSPTRSRGTVLAACNFLTFSFILVSCGLFWLLHTQLRLSPAQIFLLAGLGTLPVAVYAFLIMPDITIRFLFWIACKTFYRLRVVGDEHVPHTGGALLVSNHVTFADGVILTAVVPRLVRFLIWGDFTEQRGLRTLGRTMKVIPIRSTDGPKALVRSIQMARKALTDGELVCIFAEGGLTRTGQLQPFQPGFMKIVQGTGCPVIPVYLHGLWGSIFSYRGGKFFWKWPRKWPYPVTIVFGEPVAEPRGPHHIRQRVEELGVSAVDIEKPRQLAPIRQFVRQCKSAGSRPKLADSSGLELTGAKVLIGALAMRRVLQRSVLAADERTVGLLLPPSVGGALANMAVTLTGRTTANLNYTLSDEVLNHCVREAQIRHVLTSRKFLEKRPCHIAGAELVFLEDIKEQITPWDKAAGALATYVVPTVVLERWLGLHRLHPDDVCTIIFTSGSTGEPKGVMLSHHNVLSNIDAVDQLLELSVDDVMMGVLPFFHSFGYTITLWLPLCFDPRTVYHYNPLDARTVGELAEKHGMTILLAPPTFLKGYLKRCTKEQFARLDLVIVGAEKLPLDLARAFEEKFGVQPTEGYGTTELSPVAAVNVPDHRSSMILQRGTKLGTVGRVIPGCSAKVVDPDTWEDRGIDTEGLLLIKGPNVMRGYLNQPEKTAAVIRDGWYNTGDFARIDSEGFIEITGRQSRFSKIGGEMVPHIRIEEELNRLAEVPGSDEHELLLAVTAVPDERKGERLIVLHRPLPRPAEELLRELGERGLPNLWLPDAESFFEVAEIPLLGSGKLDLRKLQDLATAVVRRESSVLTSR